jgi:hypothetical protein
MGQGTTQEKADKMISNISKIVYTYVTENFQEDNPKLIIPNPY